ncbi:MAG: TfuA-like protein [Kofleriaceae bacterium]
MARAKPRAPRAKPRASSAKPRASRAKPPAPVAKPRTRGVGAIDVVYVGPSLAHDLARDSLPGADVRGPVAVCDVLRVVGDHVAGRVRVGRIAIIDGYFERMAAVWHKEILLALEAGIEVWGAASMGALRAAELAAFGMRGVGSIYERFASGVLVCDDEVAVAHLPAEYNYKATSVALVDLREAIAHAKIPAADRTELIELARARFYRDRTFESLIADATAVTRRSAAAHRFGDKTIERLASASSFANAKATDARLLLVTMARTAPSPPAPIAVPRTWALAQLRDVMSRRG